MYILAPDRAERSPSTPHHTPGLFAAFICSSNERSAPALLRPMAQFLAFSFGFSSLRDKALNYAS